MTSRDIRIGDLCYHSKSNVYLRITNIHTANDNENDAYYYYERVGGKQPVWEMSDKTFHKTSILYSQLEIITDYLKDADTLRDIRYDI